MNHSFLYYYPRTDQERWGYTPPGKLSVDRFINGEAAHWRQEVRQVEKLKRKLVLCDWALTGYNEAERERCIEVLQNLLDNQFVLYAVEGGDVVKLTSKNLKDKISDLNFRRGQKALDRPDLIRALALQEVAADEIGFLDYFACQQLFFNDKENRIHSSHVKRSDFEIDDIVAHLSQNTLTKPVAVRNEFGFKNLRFEKLLAAIPDAVRTEQIRSASITCQNDVETLKRTELTSLEFLTCEFSDLKLVDLLQILSKTPNLKKLHIRDAKLDQGKLTEIDFTKIDIGKLEELNCMHTSFGIHLLGQFLLKTPRIKNLDIEFNDLITGSFDKELFEKLELSQLEVLSFHGSNVQVPLVGQILSKIPNLKELTLAYCKELKGEIEEEIYSKITIKQLEELYCYGSSIGSNLFVQILYKGCKLWNINVSYCQEAFTKGMFKKPILFWNLKKLECCESSITTEALGWLLCQAPNLTYLNLMSCEHLEGKFEDKIHRLLNLKYLKKFGCSHSNIHTNLLGQILTATPQLVELHLDNCQNITTPFENKIFKKLDIPLLERLNCNHSAISPYLLSQIMSNALFIKKVGLENCKNVFSGIWYYLKGAIQFNRLEELLCANSKMDPHFFEKFLLDNAPNLKKVDVRGCIPSLDQVVSRRNAKSTEVNQKADNPKTIQAPKDSPPAQKEHATIRSRSVDANTGPSESKTYATRVFIGKDGVHPGVRDYRKNIYFSLRIKTQVSPGEDPFEWYNEESFELTPCADSITWMYDEERIRTAWEESKQADHTFSFGTIDIPPTGEEWIPIESLSPEEKITHMCIDRTYFDIQYAKKPNIYFVKNTSGESLKGFLVVDIPKPVPFDQLDPKIQRLIEKYRNEFRDKPLKKLGPNPTGHDFLKAIITKKKGSCRHRAVGFYSEVKRDKPEIEMRGNLNSCHSNIEMKHKGRWVIIDAGGSPSDLVISETNHPHLFHRQVQISKQATMKESIGEYIRHHILLYGKNALLEVHSQEELKSALGLIKGECSNVIYLSEPRPLENIPKRSVLVVNLSTFDGNDLMQFIEMAKRNSIPKDTCLIGLYILKGSFIERTEEFLELFHQKLELLPFEPTAIKQEPLPLPKLIEPEVIQEELPEQEKLPELPPVEILETDFEEIPVPVASPKVEREIPVVEPKEPFTQALLERKVLETLWDISSNHETKLTLAFESGQPTNLAELVERHILLQGKNVHIALHSPEELDLFALWLQQHIPGTYSIDRPEEIRCSAKWIDRDGTLRKGPGGKLYDYIKKAPRPVFIINFNTFEPDDIVRCNQFYDNENREADGVRIPQEACVIGLSVISLQNYKGKDFSDRFFQRFEITPFSVKSALHFEEPCAQSFPVDLYGVADWKEKFLGKWIIDGDHFVWKKGILEEHSHLEIRNGKWDREFKLFWQQQLLDKKIGLSKTDGVNWNAFQGIVTWIDQMPSDVSPLLINPSFLGQLEVNYRLENGKLKPLPGCIEKAKNSILFAYLTSHLTDAQWYQLLKQCKENQVKLHLLGPEGIHNPVECNSLSTQIVPSATLHITEDLDRAVESLVTKNPKAKTINVSECDSRLLYSWDVYWINELEFRFEKKNGSVYEMLQRGEEVILWGKFSGSLLDALMPFLLNQEKYSGKLILVTESKRGLELFQTTPVSPLVGSPKKAIESLPPLHIPKDLHPFETERLKLLYQAIKDEFHVCMEGDTGVGKTTFIKNVLAKHPDFAVFYGKEEREAWARYRGDKIPVIFEDEVDQQNCQFTCYEDINYQGNAIDGDYIPLTPKHRIVSAKNPLSFGGERREVSFLTRHPNRIEFTPLTSEYLYDVILKQYGLPEATAKLFLEVYNQESHLTPRELEMMALIALAIPDRDPRIAAYRIAKYANPKKMQQSFHDRFTSRFGQITLPKVSHDLHDFIMTDSRQEPYGLVSDFLAVRKLRQQKPLPGGLGGLVFEGIPRDGKSHFVAASLLANGFVQVAPHEIGTCKQDAFCLLPANMPLEQKKECLLAAFHAGQFVIGNEMNASSGLASLRYALAMGFDETMQPPKKRGFGFIDTQNPIYFAGRRATTTPFKHRVITYEFNPCGQREIYQIVHKKHPSISEEVIRLLTQKPFSLGELLNIVEKGIHAPKQMLSPLPQVVEQQGPVCKLYALSAVMTWAYKKNPLQYPKEPPPARWRDRKIKPKASVRQLAKFEKFTQVGEVYDPHFLVQIAKKYGFQSTTLVEPSHEKYTDTLIHLIKKGLAPIVFFDVSMNTGKPLNLGSKQEHAAICVGYFYNLQNELFFTLLHWGKPWVVNAQELADSANQLSLDREPETFYKVDGAWRHQGDRQDVAHGDFNALLGTKKVTPKTGTKSKETFRNKIIIVA